MVIDILALLRAFNGTLEKVRVFGKVTAKLHRPSNLMSNCYEEQGGMYVKVDVFAIDLSYYTSYLKDYGYNEKDNIYIVARGSSICAYVPINGFRYPDFYTLEGKLRIGSRTVNDYCILFNFNKRGKNWTITPNNLYDLDFSSWRENSQHKMCISKTVCTNELEYPTEASNFKPMRCVESFIEVAKPEKKIEIEPEINIVTKRDISTSRDIIKDYSDVTKKLKDKLDIAKSSRTDFIQNLKYKYNSESFNYIDNLVQALCINLKHKSDTYGSTGRSILLRYLKEFKSASETYLGNKTVAEYIADNFIEISKMLYDKDIYVDDKVWKVCKDAFGIPSRFYAGIVAKIIGVDIDSLLDAELICADNDIDFVDLINKNPYALQLIKDFPFKEVEYIALCFEKSNDISLNDYRNISIINSFINDKNDGSTLFIKSDLTRKKLGLTLTQSQYNRIRETGTYVSSTIKSDVKTFLNKTVQPYDLNNYSKIGYNYIKPFSSSEVSNIVKIYEKSGLGVSFDQYITSSSYLEKELYVYNKFYKLGSTPTNFNEELIKKYISEFENEMGFKLVKEQYDSVMLLLHKSGVIAGSAGSGKTTVTSCFIYVLQKLVPSIKLKFAAPTGRAAKRMQEVVKRPVKTMASEFRVGVSDSQGIFDRQKPTGVEDGVAYFLDECAMPTIDLMYSIARNLSDSCYCYLFGDYHQLPPIGKGVPFKNLLKFMPCSFLTVSKRAAEGSQITNISNIINEYSEYNNWRELESKDDFFLCPCSDEVMYSLAIVLCKYYLGKELTSNEKLLLKQNISDTSRLKPNFEYTANDIQVVTPLAKATYKWGTIQLNKVLQPIFNPTRTYESNFTYYKSPNDKFYNKFTIGDRVVHKDSNMYSMQWYSTYDDGRFQKIYGCGICNGEVGSIVGFYPSYKCTFLDEVENEPSDFEYYANMRDDSKYDGWFVVVKYHDYMDDRDFYILYRCKESLSTTNNIGIAFTGSDLGMLDLFYAGTTHKLQGSQAKIIISLLGVVNFRGFITRNMMYTVYSRGEKLVFALGSVGNERSSMLSIARTEKSEKGILTIGDILY